MNSFEGHIRGDKPVLVDFFAEWCGPCKMMTPILKEVKKVTGERTTVLKMDIDQNPQYSQLYNIQAVPTLILFKQGRILWRKSGVASASEILKVVNLHLS